MDAPWDLAVKVKYGNTLRRFGVNVHGLHIDLDINKLRTKILTLFKLDPNANISLTYTDEDGDLVTLVTDEELHDAVVGQRLNPLRINVELNTDSTVIPPAEPSGAFTGTATEGTQAKQLSYAVNEALKSVPDPLRSVLSRISHDFASKAAETAPALAEFVEYFSKLGSSHTTTIIDALNNPDLVRTSADRADSQVDPTNNGTAKPHLDDPIPQHVFFGSSSLDKNAFTKNITEHSGISKNTPQQIPKPISDLDLGRPELLSLKESFSTAWIANMEESEKASYDQTNGLSAAVAGSAPTVGQAAQDSQNRDITKQSSPVTYPSLTADDFRNEVISVPRGASPQTDPAVNNHMGAPAPPDHIPLGGPFQASSPCRRAFGHHDSTLRTFHRGVVCDGCGMNPIMGPRFKSNVKADYDLCSICFSQMGSEADYTRIDRALYRPPRFPKDFHNHHSRMHGFPGCRGPGYRLLKAKLDSRFIQDVTVMDGTPMAPLTPFTKIWRMRNNGTVEWPAGTQLMWIGGDRFSDRVSVLLEISQNGLPVSSEIDIAIDFRAPLRPGRYISYWRMASPFGQKFGQRVWVLIQVDESRPNSAGGTAPQELNLNLPPESVEASGLGAIDMNAEPVEMVPSVAVVDPSLGMVELMKPNVDLLNQAAALAALPRGSHGGFPPPWNYSALPVAAATTVPPPGGAMPGETSTGDNSIEQALLKELEEMGFKQIEVNREVLRSNEYDLEQSVNQLCGISEWDPILEELQEMGFHDKEKNKKLLVKNGGSIKRVVLDLIAGEKE